MNLENLMLQRIIRIKEQKYTEKYKENIITKKNLKDRIRELNVLLNEKDTKIAELKKIIEKLHSSRSKFY